MDKDARIRLFVPLQRLPQALQDKAVALARLQDYARGQAVYVQGEQDDLVHYLLSGTIEFIWHGKVMRSVSATHKVALRALDPVGRKRYTVRALDRVTIVTFKRQALDRLVSEYETEPGAAELEVSEIATARSSDWMIRMLQSELFSVLPATSIQKIFARMEQVVLEADAVVVRQDSPGDYYYVVEQGYCEVSRTIAAGRGQIHLADLGPGTTFGEEALISGKPRNATVTMLSDGRLMRLAKDDFYELILSAVLRPIEYGAALTEIAGGAVWLDVRYPEDHAAQALPGSENIPVNMLRLQCNRLRRDFRYLVCGDDREQCAIAAFLLGERGFDVLFLNVPLSQIAAEHPTAFVQPEATHAPAPRGTVVSFPGAESHHPDLLEPDVMEPNEMDVDAMNDRQQDSPFEDTITRIANLYTNAEAERAMKEVTPVDKYADTATGRDLADIIEELSERHDELAPGADSSPALESNSLRQIDAAGLLHDGISSIMREMEARLRQHVAAAVESRSSALAHDYQLKLARMQDSKEEELRAREAKIRESYSAKHDEKEQLLRSYYKKLIALANNISRQKAHLQEARRQFEIKLTSANQLYREVEEMRQILTEQIGLLDQQALEELPRMSFSNQVERFQA